MTPSTPTTTAREVSAVPHAPTDADLLGRAVVLCGNASEVARRIGATPARVSLARHGKAALTTAQRTALERLLADPPAGIDLPRAGRPLGPAESADGALIDRALTLPGVGTLTALAERIGIGRHQLTRVRGGQYALHAGTRDALRQLLGEPVAAPAGSFVEVSVRLTADEMEAFRAIADERGGIRSAVDAALLTWLAAHQRRLPDPVTSSLANRCPVCDAVPGAGCITAPYCLGPRHPLRKPHCARVGTMSGASRKFSVGMVALEALDARLLAERGTASPRARSGAIRQAILRAIKKSEGKEKDC